MAFVDGDLIPVRADRKAAYLDLSARMAAITREHGALRVVDCRGAAGPEAQAGFHAEGARAELGAEAGSFCRAAGAGQGEVVVLSWTEWPGRASRDASLARVMADPRVRPREAEEPVFEGRPPIAGGFEMALDA